MDKNSKENNKQSDNNANCMIVNNEDPAIYWNSAVLIIAIILLGIVMFYKLNHVSGNCVTNYNTLAGQIDPTSIMNSITI